MSKSTPQKVHPNNVNCVLSHRKPNLQLPTIIHATGTRKGTLALMPLPRNNKLYTLLKRVKFFTAIDLWSGNYYIKLDKESIPKSTFITMFGKFSFLRLPFGLLQSPDFSIRLVYHLVVLNQSSHNSQSSAHLTYLDGIIIYRRMEEEHLDKIWKAFEHLQKASLKIKLSKCSFFNEQIDYLGHLVSVTSILQQTDKIQGLVKLKPLTNIKEVRLFFSLTGYYRKFICNYADIVHPLNCLTGKSQPFIWIPDYQSNFNVRLKAVGLYHNPDFQKSQPDLGMPFESLPFIKQPMHLPTVIHKIYIKTKYKSKKNRSWSHKQFTLTYP